ncbi:hypothetical protein J5T34_03935 [Cupriavidus gilardii]|uniref:hypothetical protein n=1 Tax=Cupriavidus gilardii TaxID=82541 RepID=UPI001ABDF09D|nr:hypothetical protein [Cupriavidus gilardii]MBO4119890.1 hypothetical protein [Cupriavidus gilardii]
METAELIDQLADALKERMQPAVPLSIRLWNIEMIATYLNRNPDVVRQRVVSLPSFPPAIRLPAGETGVGKPMWKACEVIEWVESHKEAAPRRRRAAA